MDSCNNTDVGPGDETLLALQLLLHVVIAMAYFTIPMVLIYSIRFSPIFPHKMEFIYFGIAAICCGINYMTDIWKYNPHPATVTMIVKSCHAVMLWLAVVVLNSVFPDLLNLKQREIFLKNKVEELFPDSLNLKQKEIFLKNKVEELNSSLSLLLREVDTRKSFNKLIHEIRTTVDKNFIIKSTVVGLGDLLNLEECSLWFPSQTNNTLCLSNCLKGILPIGSIVSINLPVLAEIFDSAVPVRIPLTCPMVRTTSVCERCADIDVVAIRIPLHHVPCAVDHNWQSSTTNYAVMVLAPPSDSITKFRPDELELIADVAEQLSVGLAHAAGLEGSIVAYDHLRMQNSSVALALRSMETALGDSIVWRDGIFNQMLKVWDIIPFLSSFMLETTLTPEQRTVIEAALKTSSSLETLVENVRDLSRLEDHSIEFSSNILDLSATISEVVDKMKPITVVKKLSLILRLDANLPAYAVGDQERLKQVLLNILANAVKFTKEGSISVTTSVVERKSFKDWRPRGLSMVPSRNHFYLKVEVKDSGCGVEPRELPQIFTRFINHQFSPDQLSGSGLGLHICKWLLKNMGGDIWVESEGVGNGTTVTFVVKLRKNTKQPSTSPLADELCSQSEPSGSS